MQCWRTEPGSDGFIERASGQVPDARLENVQESTISTACWRDRMVPLLLWSSSAR